MHNFCNIFIIMLLAFFYYKSGTGIFFKFLFEWVLIFYLLLLKTTFSKLFAAILFICCCWKQLSQIQTLLSWFKLEQLVILELF